MTNATTSFSETTYFSAYKHIRNHYRKFNSISVINTCIEYLHKTTSNDVEEAQKQPWLILLLIKWVIIDEEYTRCERPDIQAKEFPKLLQKLYRITDFTRMPTESVNLNLFMRGMAYQQFFYQHPFSLDLFARQSLFFNSLEENHDIKKSFEELTGVSISCFIELSLSTALLFTDKKRSSINVSAFSNLFNHYTPSEIDGFLTSMCIHSENLRCYMTKTSKKNRSSFEVLEQTPFLKSPLIKSNNNFTCVYPAILYRHIEFYIYDRLRNNDASRFMGKFGKVFENYVEKSIRYSQLPYINEKQLSQHLSNRGKLIDFIINDKNSNIFIDAKAVEMSHSGKTTHLSSVLESEVKRSVIKAIEQAHSVLNQLQNKPHPCLNINSKNNYLLVITYKELYLGDGQSFYENIAKTKIDNIYANALFTKNIEPENMFFLTIQHFDKLVELINSNKVGLVELLEKIKKSNLNPKEKKFDFGMYLSHYNNNEKLNIPDFLTSEQDNIFNGIKEKLV